ncbi:MAG: hypothetical protein ACR2G2_14565 [Pseudonocardia sp.]
MNEKELAELREHFDTADLSDDIEAATWKSAAEPDPMVVTSLRLPKSLLDWVRGQADAERVKPTALIRRWLEDRRSGERGEPDVTLASLAARIDRLESVTLHVVQTAPNRSASATEDPEVEVADSVTDLLRALQRSVEKARASAADREDPAPKRRGA